MQIFSRISVIIHFYLLEECFFKKTKSNFSQNNNNKTKPKGLRLYIFSLLIERILMLRNKKTTYKIGIVVDLSKSFSTSKDAGSIVYLRPNLFLRSFHSRVLFSYEKIRLFLKGSSSCITWRGILDLAHNYPTIC